VALIDDDQIEGLGRHLGAIGDLDRLVGDERIERVRALTSLGIWFVPCVPVIVDRASAEMVASFRSMVLPDGYLEGVLTANDPRQQGISAAVDLAQRFLEIDGVAGVNLSGGGAAGAERDFAEALAEIGSELQGSHPD